MKEESLTFWRFVLTLFLAFGVAIVIQILRVPNLDDIEGRNPDRSASCRDIGRLIAESVSRPGGPVSFRENEVNIWLRKTVAGRQTGISKLFVSFEGAYLNFKEDELEVVLERRLLGRPLVVSCRCRLAPGDEGVKVQSTGSSIGNLRIRRAVVKVVLGSYRRLAAAFRPELDSLARMRKIAIEDGRIVLDPGGNL